MIKEIIESTIKDYKESYNMTPYNINTGDCDAFADIVLTKGEDLGLAIRVIVNDEKGHAWIKFKGKHYDAESPLGVSNWKDLLAIQRSIKHRNKIKEGVKCIVKKWTNS